MLILTRREEEIIRIGPDIKITVVAIMGKRVRIGIDAPKEIEVHRDEIWRRIHEHS